MRFCLVLLYKKHCEHLIDDLETVCQTNKRMEKKTRKQQLNKETLADGILARRYLTPAVASPLFSLSLTSLLLSTEVTWTTSAEDKRRPERDTGDNCVLNSDWTHQPPRDETVQLNLLLFLHPPPRPFFLSTLFLFHSISLINPLIQTDTYPSGAGFKSLNMIPCQDW